MSYESVKYQILAACADCGVEVQSVVAVVWISWGKACIIDIRRRGEASLSVVEMASRVDTSDGSENKGSMWVLDQKLDQSMDEEAGRLRNMYREKVRCNFSFMIYDSPYFITCRVGYFILVTQVFEKIGFIPLKVKWRKMAIESVGYFLS